MRGLKMNKMQEVFANEIVGDMSEDVTKDTPNGEIFQMTRDACTILEDAGLPLDDDVPIRIYKALIKYRDGLKPEKTKKKTKMKKMMITLNRK